MEANDGSEAQRFTYDYPNRLVKAEKIDYTPEAPAWANVATYVYDGLNRRVKKDLDTGTDVLYIYDGWQCAEERDANTTTTVLRQYVYGSQYIDEPVCKIEDPGGTPQKLFYLQDVNYNVVALAHTSGTIQERYNYEPYGTITIADANGTPRSATLHNNTLTFQGRRYDAESDLYYFRNRYYSPTLGRFLQRDPAGYQDGMNLYLAFLSNPAKYTDPWGEEACDNEGLCRNCQVVDAVLTPLGIHPSKVENVRALGTTLDRFQRIVGFLKALEGFATSCVPCGFSSNEAASWAVGGLAANKYPSVPAREVIDTILEAFKRSEPVGLWVKRQRECCECVDGQLEWDSRTDYVRCSRYKACEHLWGQMKGKRGIYRVYNVEYSRDPSFGGNLFMPWEVAERGEGSIFFSSLRKCIWDACPSEEDRGEYPYLYAIDIKTGEEFPAKYDPRTRRFRISRK